MKIQIDTDELKAIIDYLQNNPQIEYTPHPQYSNKIYRVLESLNYDENYLTKYPTIENKEISKMTLNDLKVMFTFIIRGERFCDGHIANYVKNGTLLALAQRELQLISKRNVLSCKNK